jgi:hypothetical protein
VDDDCAKIARAAARNAGEDFDQYPPMRQRAIRRGVLQTIVAMQDVGWVLVSPAFGELGKVAGD